jgi:predicted DNA-binding transcriptional regulator AlpA
MTRTTTTVESAVINGYAALSKKLGGRSMKALYTDHATGRIPEGFLLGNARMWIAEEVDSWLAAGCPHRDRWAPMWQARQQARR